MSKAKEVFNAFFARIETLKSFDLVGEVVKTGIDHVEKINTLEVSLGDDSRTELTAQLYEHELGINVDIHVRSLDTSLDDTMLDIRQLVEDAVFGTSLGLDYIHRINFIAQSSPLYNAPGTDYASATRLEYMIQYKTSRENQDVDYAN